MKREKAREKQQGQKGQKNREVQLTHRIDTLAAQVQVYYLNHKKTHFFIKIKYVNQQHFNEALQC